MLLFLCTAVSVRSEELTYKVRIHLKSSATGMGELYYDTGAGFVQGQSVAQTVTASQTLEAIDFDLPAGIRLTGLRLDPLDVPGTFEIGEAEIYSPDGKILRKLASSSFLPEQQLMTLSRNAKTLVVEAPAGSFYPVLRINVGEPLRLPRRQRASEVVLHWTLTVVALTLLVITVLRRFRSDTFQRIRSWFDVLPLSGVDSIARKISDPHLIVFDRVSLMILGAAAAVFLLCSGLKLHGSSSAFWDFYIAGKKPQTGVLLGEPKLFRMDEWSVFTPNIFSQIYSKPAFSATNQSVGGGTTVLFWSSPVNHFSELPRFHLWAFHFLPVDFAFSVYWNLKGLILFTGTFLLLMLLTDSRPLLSGAGALWIYFSSITQWWFSHCLPEVIGFGSLTLVAGAYLILTRKRGLLWTAAIALIIAALNFALIFYPPFTIPVMWVMVCTGIGVFWERRKLLTGEDPLRLRWLLLSFSLLCILATLGAFYVDTRDTIKLITSTVYPGNRVSTGGDGSVAALISSLIDQIYTEGHFPKFLTNIGEASSFHLVGLIVLPAIFLRRRGGPALSITDFAIVACLAGFLIFFLFGFPETMAKATLMSLTLSTRTKSGLGLAAIFLLVRHFARCASFEGPKKLHWVIAFGLAAVASTAILHFLEASKFDVPKSAVFHAHNNQYCTCRSCGDRTDLTILLVVICRSSATHFSY